MITVHLHGIGEHLAFLALVLLCLAAPAAFYVMGRSDGRDATDDEWREFLEYGAFDGEDES